MAPLSSLGRRTAGRRPKSAARAARPFGVLLQRFRPAFGIRHPPAFSIQHSAFGIQHSSPRKETPHEETPPPRARPRPRAARVGDHGRRTARNHARRLLPRRGDDRERLRRKRAAHELPRAREDRGRGADQVRLHGPDVPRDGRRPRLRRHGGQRPRVRPRRVENERHVDPLGQRPRRHERHAVRHGLPLGADRQEPQREQRLRGLRGRLAPRRNERADRHRRRGDLRLDRQPSRRLLVQEREFRAVRGRRDRRRAQNPQQRQQQRLRLLHHRSARRRQFGQTRRRRRTRPGVHGLLLVAPSKGFQDAVEPAHRPQARPKRSHVASGFRQ